MKFFCKACRTERDATHLRKTYWLRDDRNYSTVTEYSYPTQYLTFLDYRPVLKQIKHSKNLTIWVNTQYNLGNYPNKGIVLCR